MAHRNKRIANPFSGQSIVFLQTAADTRGELLEMESTYAAHSKKPAEHYHPVQQEDFTVLQGEITMLLDDQDVLLRAGDVVIQRGTNHAWSNRSDKPALMLYVLIDGEFDAELKQKFGDDGH